MNMDGSDRVIVFENVVKRYGAVSALEDFSMEVTAGQVVGFVGENSAGKSTSMKLAMGFLKPTLGSVSVFGVDPRRFAPEDRMRIGYVSEEQNLPPWMTVDQMLKFHSSFYPRWNEPRARDAAVRFDLPLDRPLRGLSKGQRRRVHLLLSLAQDPDLLLLDEPASGLDAEARVLFVDMMNELLADRPRTIFFSSHIFSDVERIATHMAMIHHGKLLHYAETDSIRERVRKLRCPSSMEEAIGAAFTVIGRESDGTFSHLWVNDFSEENLRAAVSDSVAAVEPLDTDLEAVYVALIRHARATRVKASKESRA